MMSNPYLGTDPIDVSMYSTKIFKGECPKCNFSIKINSSTSDTIKSYGKNQKVINAFECPSCDEIILQVWNEICDNNFKLINEYPQKASRTNFNEEIKTISEKFIQIYNEAETAENNQLFNICGPGYRKSLEFLIKDYIIYKYPDKIEDVKKQLLGYCISNFIEDPMLKDIAERAVWIGNDETHYIRTWENKDLNDMKGFIRQVIYSIENELQYEKMKKEMPKKKR